MKNKIKIFFNFLVISFFILTSVNFLLTESKFFDIPYSKQYKSYSCSQNAFRMVMAYWGFRLSKTKIFLMTGYRPSNFRKYKEIIKKKYPNFSTKDIPKESNFKSLIKEIEKKHPVMIGVETIYLKYLSYSTSGGHVIIIIGCDDEKKIFYLRDPNSENIEKLSFIKLSKAWKKNIKGLCIYRKDNKYIAQKDINHFNKAMPFGKYAKRKKLSPIVLFIPTLYINNVFDLNKSKDDFLFSPNYTVKLLSFFYLGKLSLEKIPAVGLNKNFDGVGFSMGYSLSKAQMIVDNDDNITTGIFNEVKNVSLNIFSFSSIKRIKNLTIIDPIIQADIFGSYKNYKLLNKSPFLNVFISELRGGRIGLRSGLGLFPGYIGLAFNYGSFVINNIPIKDVLDTSVKSSGSGYDIQLSIFEYATFKAEGNFYFLSGKKIGFTLYHAFPCFQIHPIAIPLILLIHNSYFTYENQIFRTDYIEDWYKTMSIESFLSLAFFDTLYGFMYKEEKYKESLYIEKIITRKISLGINFNQFLPFFQFQLRGSVSWTPVGNDIFKMEKSITIGIYAGLF